MSQSPEIRPVSFTPDPMAPSAALKRSRLSALSALLPRDFFGLVALPQKSGNAPILDTRIGLNQRQRRKADRRSNRFTATKRRNRVRA